MKKLLSNKNLLVVVLAVLCGVLLIIFGSIGDGKNVNEEDVANASYPGKELESYTSALEKRVTEHIERINGVSNVSVLITIEGTNEKVYATEGSGKDYVIIKDSSGSENAVVLTEINASVRGIAVVCDYGENNELRQQIITMLSSLFNIGSNRISVMSG